MVSSIEKSIANTSTTDVEKYKTNSAIAKGYKQKIIASRPIQFFLKISITYLMNYAHKLNIIKSNSSSKKQETSPYIGNHSTLEGIRVLIDKEKYQDAEKSIKKMLRKNCNISCQDNKGNNLLHYIALLPKEKKTKCAELAVEKLLKEQSEAVINAKNKEGLTPIKKALIAKVKQVKSSQGNNTTNFCIVLLRNGATDPEDQLTLPERFHNELYYRIVKKIRGETGTHPNIETWEKLQMKFSKKSHPKFGSDAIIIGLICATGFTALGGNMIIAAHLSIIVSVCVAFSLLYDTLTHSKQNSVENKPDQEKGPSTLLNTISTITSALNRRFHF